MRVRKWSCAKLIFFLLIGFFLILRLPQQSDHIDHAPGEGRAPSGGGRKMAAEEKEDFADEKSSDEPSGGPGEDSLAGLRVHGLPNISSSREEEEKDRGVDIKNILARIEKENKGQDVRNVDKFGPVTNETVVIIIQVHNRESYLKQLITSLSAARHIEKTLLVFSHDVWDDQINTLVRGIEFSLVVQMFYPFSLQTHPHSFPGESAKDCPRDAKPEKAATLGCTNSKWPDIHGHYREAKFTQTKHHWWWKTNRVFNGLDITKDFHGSVLFIEEDHYVSTDFLHVLDLMKREKARLKQKVDMISLGTYLKRFNFKLHAKQVEVNEWISSKHNMGMAFTREVWGRIVSCSPQFCEYDDYNWDWSLQHISHSCLKEKLQVMMVRGPRVFHIGECGVHHKKSDCDSSAALDKVTAIIRSALPYFFPERLTLVKTLVRKKVKLKKGNGGWGDKRDHKLCHNMTLPQR